jgi:hypothetical protein
MKRTLFLAALTACLSGIFPNFAKADPFGWIDVTASPYFADNTGSADAGPAINLAIKACPQFGCVIVFPTGTYRLKTGIVDDGTQTSGIKAQAITYLGLGNVYVFADISLRGAMLTFGGPDTARSVQLRTMKNFWIECGRVAGLDGIDIADLYDSTFDQVEIRDCANWSFRTLSPNANFQQGLQLNHVQVLPGGAVTGGGIYLGPEAFYANLLNVGVGNGANNTGVGIQIEGHDSSCTGCLVKGFDIDLLAGTQNPNSTLTCGLEISGGGFLTATTAPIRIGSAGSQFQGIQGLSIHGAEIWGDAGSPNCIDVQQALGFTIQGNSFFSCPVAVHTAANATFQGGNNGAIGPNNLETAAGTTTYSLQGTDNTLQAPACQSALSPASCGYFSSGMAALGGSGILTVNSSFVTTTSRILIAEDSTLTFPGGSVTCNTTRGRTHSIINKVAGSFTIGASSAPGVGSACLVFKIEN